MVLAAVKVLLLCFFEIYLIPSLGMWIIFPHLCLLPPKSVFLLPNLIFIFSNGRKNQHFSKEKKENVFCICEMFK
uniref:Uncharacterized protein n=1 Tax=Gallus gallus TaxID=9031 RepID=Q90798_CHICK|nr:unknown [Gallus gallus]